MAAKAKQNPIDVYLAGVSDPAARASLAALRKQLRRLLPSATETLSYGMPAYRLESGKVAAGFGFFGRNCGLYPHSGNVMPRLAAQLEGFRTSKAGVTFAPDAPLPASVVKAVVATRLEELAGAAPAGRARRAATGARKRAPGRGARGA